jgi:hypothetical protein
MDDSYSEAAAVEILTRRANGETLRSICEDDHLPSEKVVRRWADNDVHGFADRYSRAFDAFVDVIIGDPALMAVAVAMRAKLDADAIEFEAVR